MFVIFRLYVLLTVCRSNSVYRSFSALAALIKLSHSYNMWFVCCTVYRSFAADGCIFKLETLARCLADSCAEKEYLLALVDLGRAAFIAGGMPNQRYDGVVRRAELLDAIHLQQYVPSPPTQSYLIVFLQSAQRRLACFRSQSVHRLCKISRFPPLATSLCSLSHR